MKRNYTNCMREENLYAFNKTIFLKYLTANITSLSKLDEKPKTLLLFGQKYIYVYIWRNHLARMHFILDTVVGFCQSFGIFWGKKLNYLEKTVAKSINS